MTQVFLGGTCNNSQWREELKPLLNIDYFDPVVPNWNEAAQAAEIAARENSEYCLYVITPKMTGVYSIAEIIDDSNKRPDKIIFAYTASDEGEEFSAHQLKSLKQVAKMVIGNGGEAFIDPITDFATLAGILNKPVVVKIASN